MYEFDLDTNLREEKPGIYRGELTERWNIGTVPNGGYVMCVALAAIRQAVSAPDPLTATAHFLRASAPGPVEVHVEVIKRGRLYSTVSARLVQNGRENVRLLATYGDLAGGDAPTHVFAAPPELSAREQLTGGRPAGAPEFTRRVEMRFAERTFSAVAAGEMPETRGWMRFADGRRPDVHALPLIADSFPPAAFRVLPPGWMPTLELTVHVRARPVSEWVRCAFRTRFIFGGLLEEDGEIWDENGTLLALSRQLAALPR